MIHFTLRIGALFTALIALQSVAQATTIRFDDEISPDTMNALVAKVAAAYDAGDRNIAIELNSGGGNLGAALKAGVELKKYAVNTVVKDDCDSACTVLFAAGQTRTASNGSEFMFHAVNVESFPHGLTREGVAADYAARWLAAVRAVSPSLAARLEKDRTLISGDETYFSGRDLRDTGYVND